jgi:hypothetical protein
VLKETADEEATGSDDVHGFVLTLFGEDGLKLNK